MILWIAIIARVILSWLPIGSQGNPLVAVVYQVTEPILAPLRRIIPRLGMFDLSPMIAIFLLYAIMELVNKL
jgi:YggT family protein